MAKFQFSIGNMLRSTAWIAVSAASWAVMVRGLETLPGTRNVQFCLAVLVINLLIAGPMFAVSALFGSSTKYVGHIAIATYTITGLALLLLPSIE